MSTILGIFDSPRRESLNTPMSPDLPKTEMVILEMTNAFRRENSVAAVRADPKLTAVARAYARYLAQSGRFAHEADGRKPHQRAEAQGYKFCFVAENLAMDANARGFSERGLAQEAMNGWKNSPMHRENLLRPGATDIGIGVAKAPDHPGKYISVQVFGRPDSARIAFRIENKAGFPITYVVGQKTLTLEERITVTHRSCNPTALSFPTARVRYEPGNGEHYVVKAAGADRIVVEKK